MLRYDLGARPRLLCWLLLLLGCSAMLLVLLFLLLLHLDWPFGQALRSPATAPPIQVGVFSTPASSSAAAAAAAAAARRALLLPNLMGGLDLGPMVRADGEGLGLVSSYFSRVISI